MMYVQSLTLEGCFSQLSAGSGKFLCAHLKSDFKVWAYSRICDIINSLGANSGPKLNSEKCDVET